MLSSFHTDIQLPLPLRVIQMGPIPIDISVTQLLQPKLREHLRRGGRKILRVTSPAALKNKTKNQRVIQIGPSITREQPSRRLKYENFFKDGRGQKDGSMSKGTCYQAQEELAWWKEGTHRLSSDL